MQGRSHLQGRSNHAFLGMNLFLTFVLILQFFFWMSPSHEAKIRQAYLWPITITVFAYILWWFFSNRKSAPKETLIGLLIPLWLLITTVINGDAYLVFNQRFILGCFLAFGIFFAAFMLMDERQVRNGLQLIGYAMIALFGVVACIGIAVTVFQTELGTPFSQDTIRIFHHRLYVFDRHPNEVGCIWAGLIFWAAYLFSNTQKRWIRGLLCLFCLLAYISIALTVSWTSKLATAAGLGLVAFAGNQWHWKWGKGARMLLSLVLAGGVAALSIAGFSVVLEGTNAAIDQLPKAMQTFQEKTYRAAKAEALTAEHQETETAAARSGGDALTAPKERNLFKNLQTFTGRTDLWKAGIDAIGAKPSILLLGLTDGQVARVPVQMQASSVFHLHNAWLEMLLLGGIPGLLLFLWLTASVLVRGMRLFFGQNTSFGLRMIALGAGVMFLHCTMEIYPAFSGTTTDFLFMILAAVVLREGSKRALVANAG